MRVLVAGVALLLAAGCSRAPAPPPAPPAGTAPECGANAECVIQAARSCTPARGQRPTAFQVLGVRVSSTTLQEIHGPEGGRCVFSFTLGRSDAVLAPDTLERLQKGGMSTDDVVKLETRAREILAAREGEVTTCRPTPDALVAALTRWKAAAYSAQDLDPLDCRPGAPTACRLAVTSDAVVLRPGMSMGLTATGAREGVTWRVDGPRAVQLSAEQGDKVVVTGLEPGGLTTRVLATDRGGGPECIRPVVVRVDP